jgi:ATP-dependent RNA helicase DDX41
MRVVEPFRSTPTRRGKVEQVHYNIAANIISIIVIKVIRAKLIIINKMRNLRDFCFSISSLLPTPMVSTGSNGPQPTAEDQADDDFLLPEDYKPYVPVAKRRAALLSHLGSKHLAKKVRGLVGNEGDGDGNGETGVDEDEEAREERKREMLRRERTLLHAAQEVKEKQAKEDADKTTAQLAAEKEAKLLEELERAQKKLAGVQELAQGTSWTQSLETS